MSTRQIQFDYQLLTDSRGLEAEDLALLVQARAVTAKAYAPYSRFRVGAAARMADGSLVLGTNQENAAYPVGICAERTLLGSAATLHPGVAIETMAVSYQSSEGASDRPISPCGVCRQTLLEYENRTGRPIRLILSGQTGEVIIIHTAADLLPFAFTSTDMGT